MHVSTKDHHFQLRVTINISLSPAEQTHILQLSYANSWLDRENEGQRANPLILFSLSLFTVCLSAWQLGPEVTRPRASMMLWLALMDVPLGQSGSVPLGEGARVIAPSRPCREPGEWISTAGNRASVSVGLRDGPLHLLQGTVPSKPERGKGLLQLLHKCFLYLLG